MEEGKLATQHLFIDLQYAGELADATSMYFWQPDGNARHGVGIFVTIVSGPEYVVWADPAVSQISGIGDSPVPARPGKDEFTEPTAPPCRSSGRGRLSP
jgi:hypothetical protein